MQLIHNLSKADLTAVCTELGQPDFRAKQIWNWLYVKFVQDWNDMLNIPSDLRQKLESEFLLTPCSVKEVCGNVSETQKILLCLQDNENIESVIIPIKDRITVCVSTQVGCKFNCSFCASGKSGFRRNLEKGEIVGQVITAAKICGRTPTHVVFMGIGEPFDNYDNVIAAARVINKGDGINIGARKITISTCGIIPGIRRMSKENIQLELSVSLHAPDNALRSKLMPVNKKYPLHELITACNDYTKQTNRIITYEYTLIQGVNDSSAQAKALAKLLRPLHCRVNLIPLSAVKEFGNTPSTQRTADMFIETLQKSGVNSTLRSSKGNAIKAACGQLRAMFIS